MPKRRGERDAGMPVQMPLAPRSCGIPNCGCPSPSRAGGLILSLKRAVVLSTASVHHPGCARDRAPRSPEWGAGLWPRVKSRFHRDGTRGCRWASSAAPGRARRRFGCHAQATRQAERGHARAPAPISVCRARDRILGMARTSPIELRRGLRSVRLTTDMLHPELPSPPPPGGERQPPEVSRTPRPLRRPYGVAKRP